MVRRVVREGDPAPNVGRHCYPLWSVAFEGPQAGRLWLPGVRTFVYTVSGSRYQHPPHIFRRQRCSELLGRLGFEQFSFFWGRRCEPYWRAIAEDHAELLSTHEAPLLILEDDIEYGDWQSNVMLPVGAQVLQLGGGRGGDRRGIYAARWAGLKPIDCYRYAYLPINTEWMRVFGMWFCHAILWLDTAVMREAAALLRTRGEMVDSTYACEQWRWQWYCRYVPMLWQNDGHHFRDTRYYQPRRGRVRGLGPRSR